MVEAVGKATSKIIQTQLGKSASYALDLEAKVSVEVIPGRKYKGKAPDFVKDLAKKTLKQLGYPRLALEIKVDSQIPSKAGLGELEALSVATILATTGALARLHGSINELKIDVYTRHQFFIIDEKLVDKNKLLSLCPGEYDRLFTSLNGGFVVTDNRKKEVIRRGEMETMPYVLAIPAKAQKIDKDLSLLFRHELELMWEECSKGNLYSAMRFTSLLYRDETANKMLRAGAIITNTTYPSTIAITRDTKKIKDIAKAAKGNTIILGGMGNTESQVLVKPKKIVKSKEFLKIKGNTDYYFL